MRPLRIPALSLLALLAVVGCENPVATFQSPTSLTRSVTTQATLDAEIRALVTAGFPAGQATAILANWDQVVRIAARTPKVTLKGKSVPGSQGRTALTRTLSFLQLRTSAATPPAGETAEHLVARIALDMSLYVYGGPDAPVPAITGDADVAFKVVSPTSTDTVVTPALEAAVVFPAGAVSEPTVVVITPDSTYWPANCSGPLDTGLCQYPRFYHFNVFPDVKLSTPAKVQVCHVDAGNNRLPLADHDRFRIAHEKPASPSDYSAGSTIVDNVEILAITPLNVTHCTANGGTDYTAPPVLAEAGVMGRLGGYALGLAQRARAAAASLLTPREALAIDVGLGGTVEIFSVFGVVDPLGQADLAQSLGSGTYFAPLMTVIPQGGTIATTSWHVNNVGSRTSGAFTSSVILATDSALTNAVVTIPLSGAPALVPGSYFSYPAQSVAIPPSLTPGTYFLGTRVTPASPDSASDDDWRSYRITVNPSLASTYDVAILPGFTVSAANVVQGTSVVANPYSVKNLGGALSDTFALRVVLATDTLLTSPVWSTLQNGYLMLAPGATYPASGATVAISPCQAPGTYFLGARIDHTVADVVPANDQVSARINVLAAPAPTQQSAGSAAWTGAGPGTLTEQVNPHCAVLSYNHTPSSLSTEQWTFTTTAVSSGNYTFNWTYDGLHSWYMAHEALEAFADGPNGTVTITLVQDQNGSTGNGFSHSGTATLPLYAGYSWGVRPSGGHYDSSLILMGTVKVMDP